MPARACPIRHNAAEISAASVFDLNGRWIVFDVSGREGAEERFRPMARRPFKSWSHARQGMALLEPKESAR